MNIRHLAEGELCKTKSLSLFTDGEVVLGRPLPEFSWKYCKFPYGLYIEGATTPDVLSEWVLNLAKEIDASELIWRKEPAVVGTFRHKNKTKLVSDCIVYFLKESVGPKTSSPKMPAVKDADTAVAEYGRILTLNEDE